MARDMASGGPSQLSDVPDMYNCSICLEHLHNRNPRFLECFHYFCEACLQRLVRNNKISCPTCRRNILVPNNDVTQLQMNYLLIQMMEREAELEQQVTAKCVYCSATKAKCKCQDCGHLLCSPCREKHNQVKSFKEHVIQSLCPKHDDGVTHICMECCEEICKICIVFDHAAHESKIKSIEEGVTCMKEEASRFQNLIQQKMSDLSKNMEQKINEKETIHKQCREIETQNKALHARIQANNMKLTDIDDTERILKADITLFEKKESYYNSLLDLIVVVQSSDNNSRLIPMFKTIQDHMDSLKDSTSNTEPSSNVGSHFSAKTDFENPGSVEAFSLPPIPSGIGPTGIIKLEPGVSVFPQEDQGRPTRKKCNKYTETKYSCKKCHIQHLCEECLECCHVGHSRGYYVPYKNLCQCGTRGPGCQLEEK